MAKIDYNNIRAMLNEPNLTDNSIAILLEDKGIKSEAGAEKWARGRAAPSQGSFWSRGFGGVEGVARKAPGAAKTAGNFLNKTVGPGNTPSWIAENVATLGVPELAKVIGGNLVGGVEGLISGGGGDPKKAAKKGKGGESAAEKAAAAARARTAALEKQVASSPWTVMADYTAQQYQQAAQAAQGLINPYAGGQNSQYAQEAGAATQNALALTGMGGNAGSWLAQQQAAANAVTAPVQQAMGQEAGVYAKEAGPISNAVLAFGQANALSEITAPEMSWLNALASHITSNLSYYGEVPSAALPTFQANPALGTAIQQSGGYGGAGGAGLTPVANVPTLAGTPRSNATGLAGIGTGVPGGTSYGTVPTPGPGPSS
jgi:hypothetical protein